jgi:hypothetical protein
MQTTIARIGAVAALACCLAAFTGTAIAGNGNGNGNGNANGNAAAGNAGTPPGQEKKADQADAATAQPTAEPAAQPAAQPATPAHGNANAPGQQKKAASAATGASSHGQAKQAGKAAVSTPGVKPSNTTSHWTKCTTGGTSASTTCLGNGPKADGSKQYGNGKTAAQIAVSRGGTGVVLTGPGNSQPHKVAICPKKTNKSGGVDVHAVKSYSTAVCAKQETIAKATTPSLTTMTTTVTPSALQPSPQPIATTQAPLTRTPAGGTTGGGALGVETTVAKSPKSGGAGGVLGAAAKLRTVAAKGTLPFTGLPLWSAMLAALALIGTGLALRGGRPAEA